MKLIEKLDYKNSIGLILRTTEKSLEHALDSEIKERCKLTSAQWKVIIVLAIREGISQKDVADLIGVESPTLVPIIDKMEKNGLLVRMTNPDDRRSNSIVLTKKSQDLVAGIVNTILDFRSLMTKGISKQNIELTRTVLLKMTHNVDEFMANKGQKVLPSLLND
jgi:MarR family transcriptional regulator for hemolysin